MEKCTRKCGKCHHLTNVPENWRGVDNVMGGCFLDAHITTTDTDACDQFENYIDNSQ